MSPTRERLIAGAVIVLVAAAVAGGILVLGSPAEARLRRLDERRVDDLVAIARATNTFLGRRGRLPQSVDSLSVAAGPYLRTRDPVTAEPYEYRALGDSSYEVCANFARASDRSRQPAGDAWFHAGGRRCFPLRAGREPPPRW